MKKTMKEFFALAIIVFTVVCLTACGQKTDGSLETEDARDGQLQHVETIEMDGDSIAITLPEGWGARGDERISIALPFTIWSRGIELIPPADEKVNVKITVGKTESGGPLKMEQFDGVVEERAESLLPFAVEESPKITYVQLKNGYGKHFTLTDASLVDGVIPSDEFLNITTYYITNNDGYLIYSTLLCDDQGSEILETMLDIVSSIEASFGETPPAGI